MANLTSHYLFQRIASPCPHLPSRIPHLVSYILPAFLHPPRDKRQAPKLTCLQFVKLWAVDFIDVLLIAFDILQLFFVPIIFSFFVLGDTLEKDCLGLLELRLGLGLEGHEQS